ncbi:MAG: glycosyltransferase family 4 protein [Calditrichaeota bacterium]|nr:glycosyltransferase family 4 protein [Calditrichota bacterium]
MKKQKTCMVFIGKYPHDVRVRREAEALHAAGYQVDAVCLQYPEQPQTETVNGVNVHRLKIRRQRESKLGYLKTYFLFTILALVKILHLHRQEHFSVIHAHNVPDILVFSALGAKIFGAKIVLDMHEIMPEFFQRKYAVRDFGVIIGVLKFLERLMIRFTDHVIVATPFLKKIVENRSAPRGKVTTILNLTDPKYFNSKRVVIKKMPRPFKLIYPGTFSHIHGVDLAIRAVKKLIDGADVPVELHLYGTGDEEENLQQMIRHLQLEKNVYLQKEVRIDEIADILQEMDCGLVPKRDGVFIGEAISTKMFDFAAVGLPTICSRTSGDSLYFDDSRVLFFEPEDVDELAACIKKLYEDYPLRLSLAKNISALFQRMNWTTEQKKLVKIYSQLTEKK